MVPERDRLFFVGSIPLPSAEDVFRLLSREVGPFLRRMPDGETGERTLWIRFQQKMLAQHPVIEPDTSRRFAKLAQFPEVYAFRWRFPRRWQRV
jgi:hypothetical protein